MFNTFATPWTIVRQTPLSMRFPRQEYWSGLPFPSLGDLPGPGESTSSALAGRFFKSRLYKDLNCQSLLGQSLSGQSYCLYVNNQVKGAVLRWRRNRTGRPLSLPQIHQKIIWMLGSFHKTIFVCWRRTPGIQKCSPLSLKGGRTKHKRWKERQKS